MGLALETLLPGAVTRWSKIPTDAALLVLKDQPDYRRILLIAFSADTLLNGLSRVLGGIGSLTRCSRPRWPIP